MLLTAPLGTNAVLTLSAGVVGLWLILRLRRRILLSRAKPLSLEGHSRLARLLASFVPSYDFPADQVFSADGAPPEVVERRRHGFTRIAESLKHLSAETAGASERLRRGLSDLQFTTSYSVPFPFRRFVNSQIAPSSLVTSSAGLEVVDADGTRAFDLSGSYGANLFGYDFYKQCIDAGIARARALGPVLGPYLPIVEDNVARLQQISGQDEVSFDMSGTEAVMRAEAGCDMNVAIFTDNDFSKVNGVTTTLRAVLANAPDDMRLRVYTCESEDASDNEYFAAKSWGIGIPFYREMRVHWPPFQRLRRQAREDGAEVVHFTTPGPVGLAGLRVASQEGLPVVGSFHTDLAEYTRLLSGSKSLGRLMHEYLRWPYGKCDRILVPSEATREILVRARIAPDKLSLWTRGVSTEAFSPSRRSWDLKCRWGAERVPVLLYVGRVSKEKGLDMLPALSGRLTKARVNHRLVVIGDGPMRPDLQRRCPDAVFTGLLSQASVAVAMASADLFVFPSRTDTAGNVVLEAQASGLPVLVSNAGGPRENVLDGRTGYVCHDERAFAFRIAELLNNADRREFMRREARLYAASRSWAAALAPLFRAYREVRRIRRDRAPIDLQPAVASSQVA